MFSTNGILRCLCAILIHIVRLTKCYVPSKVLNLNSYVVAVSLSCKHVSNVTFEHRSRQTSSRRFFFQNGGVTRTSEGRRSKIGNLEQVTENHAPVFPKIFSLGLKKSSRNKSVAICHFHVIFDVASLFLKSILHLAIIFARNGKKWMWLVGDVASVCRQPIKFAVCANKFAWWKTGVSRDPFTLTTQQDLHSQRGFVFSVHRMNRRSLLLRITLVHSTEMHLKQNTKNRDL